MTHHSVSKPVQLSQQGLYRKATEHSVAGAISLNLKNNIDSDQEELVRLCQAVYNNIVFKHEWIVGFSYDFSKIALHYLNLKGSVDSNVRELHLDSSADKEGDGTLFTNNNHHAIILSYAANIDTFLEQREEFRRLLEQKLGDKVEVFESFGLQQNNRKILGGRFFDGTNNVHDIIGMERHVIKTRDNEMQGSTFLFTQVFDFDQRALGTLKDEEMENMIGRSIKHQHFLGSSDNAFSHVERIRTVTGMKFQMLRLPFILLTDPQDSKTSSNMRSQNETRNILETCDIINPPNAKSSNLVIESGLYFAGFCRSPGRIKDLLDVLSGGKDNVGGRSGRGEVQLESPDRLLTFMKGIAGGYFWIPPSCVLSESLPLPNWLSRELHSIWDIQRRNEYMFFNMPQWSHIMSTGKYLAEIKTNKRLQSDETPSNQILHLCNATFDRWRARWLRDLSHVKLPHLEEILIANPHHLPEDFCDANGNLPEMTKAKEERQGERNIKYRKFNDSVFAVPAMGFYIKDIPVVMRKGLAIREQLRLFTENPEIRTALDTFRLEPGEIVVGTLEEYSSASGKLAVEYLCYGDERHKAKAATLSELSAMGHIVPDYGIILNKGLRAMLIDLDDRIRSASEPNTDTKVHFWKGAKYALQGIRLYLENFANLAKETRERLECGEYQGPNSLIGLHCCRQYELSKKVKDALPLPLRDKIENSQGRDSKTDSQKTGKYLDEISNLNGIESTLRKLILDKPSTLIEAVQLFFATHACLHLTADPVSAGRLDQLFQPFFEEDLNFYKNHVRHLCKNADKKKLAEYTRLAEIDYRRSAQEIIDALCLKWSDKVELNMSRIPDANSFGNCAVIFGTGPFATGDSNNQWIHQVSLGGMKNNSNIEGEDSSNDITLFFLRAMRRLPLIAPCLSLRVNEQTKPEILEEAAKAILSGGAHPIIFHDNNVSKGLHAGLTEAYKDVKHDSLHYSPEKLITMSRQYACDGCYEPMLSGYSDFSFLYVSLMESLECALNRGATYKAAGNMFLRGRVINWSSPPVDEIHSFDHLYDLTIKFHLDQQLRSFYGIPLTRFGALADFCPSPLLSNFMHEAVERGRDVTQGGAMVHIITPMFTGLSNFIDSLFAIQIMIYHKILKVTTLHELTHALVSDWGERDETWKPFLSAVQIRQTAERYKYLRQLALSLPKFGGPDQACDDSQPWINESMRKELRKELNEFGKRVTTDILKQAKNIAREVYSEINMKDLQKKFSDPEFPFHFTVCVGGGTFENYVGVALDLGASADGRLAGQPIASDCSPAPSPIDLPPLPLSTSFYRDIREALEAYDHESFHSGFGNACEVDINIVEDTSVEALRDFISDYANNRVKATSILTFTTGNPDRYAAAITQPQQYELFRVRMGGWSNFYIAQWLVHQQHHQRRPFYKIGPRPINNKRKGQEEDEKDGGHGRKGKEKIRKS